MAEAESPDISVADAPSDDRAISETQTADGGLFAGDPALSQDAGQSGYRVLARKYRPQSFADLIGQEPMVQTLRNAFAAGRIAQAYMLTGVRGVGKTTTARILARALNYEAEDGSTDGPTLEMPAPGRHCTAILASRHIDVIEIDAASNTSVDNIREIIDAVPYRPAQARFKVYIIDEVHMLSKGAFNALLKTLEEPPAHVKFIFATTEIRKVPVTVLSRCQRFDLRRIEPSAMAAHLTKVVDAEGVSATPDALTMIVRAGEGSVRDCLSILDQAIAHGSGTVDADIVRDMLGLADRAVIIDLFRTLMAGDIKATFETFDRLYGDGAEPVSVLRDLAEFTHLITRIRFVPDARNDADLPEELRKAAEELGQSLPMAAINRGWQLLTKGLSEVSHSDMPKAAADMVLVRVAHAATLPDPDKARAILEGLPEASTGNSSTNRSTGNGDGTRASVIPAASNPGGDKGGRETAVQSGAPRLQARASGSAALSLASAQIEPAPSETVTPKPVISLARFEDVIALADEYRDILFKTRLERHVRLVRFEPPRIEFNLEPDAPGDLVQEISTRLEDWTGQRWIAVLSREEGEPPIAEQRASVARDRHAAILRDPLVAAIMETFPGAQLIEDELELNATSENRIDAGRTGSNPEDATASDGDDSQLVYDDSPDDEDDDY
ncbi:MAG: DNA polymerase III subunit gamma/tau [Pseudomonadota bacterium]